MLNRTTSAIGFIYTNRIALQPSAPAPLLSRMVRPKPVGPDKMPRPARPMLLVRQRHILIKALCLQVQLIAGKLTLVTPGAQTLMEQPLPPGSLPPVKFRPHRP